MQNYARVRKLGEGGFGQVFLVKDKRDNEEYVMKVVDLSKLDAKGRNDALREAEYLKKFRHPNIIGYQEYFQIKSTQQTRYGSIPTEKLYIVMQYADGGDLESKIKSRQPDRYFTEDEVLDWFVQMALALKHIHDRKILHRDIKSQNVFLMKATGIAKLGDFGIAKSLNSTKAMARTMIGTPFYLSPEICRESAYDHKSDVWSLGVVLYELLALHHPFQANNMKDLLARICNTHPPPPPAQFSRALRLLLARMLDKNPACRPSINEVLASPLIRTRISKYLSANAMREEFSHTVLHAGGLIRAAFPQGVMTQLVGDEPILEEGANEALEEKRNDLVSDARQLQKATDTRSVLGPPVRIARPGLGVPGRRAAEQLVQALGIGKPPAVPQAPARKPPQLAHQQQQQDREAKAAKDQQELIARHLAELKRRNAEIEALSKAREKAESEERKRALEQMAARDEMLRLRKEQAAQRQQEAVARRDHLRDAVRQMREERARNKQRAEGQMWGEPAADRGQGRASTGDEEIQIFEGPRGRNPNSEAVQELALRGWMKEKEREREQEQERERERERARREEERASMVQCPQVGEYDRPIGGPRRPPAKQGGFGSDGIMIYEGRKPSPPTPPPYSQQASVNQPQKAVVNSAVRASSSVDTTPATELTYEQQLARIREQNVKENAYMRAKMHARQHGLPEPSFEEFMRRDQPNPISRSKESSNIDESSPSPVNLPPSASSNSASETHHASNEAASFEAALRRAREEAQRERKLLLEKAKRYAQGDTVDSPDAAPTSAATPPSESQRSPGPAESPKPSKSVSVEPLIVSPRLSTVVLKKPQAENAIGERASRGESNLELLEAWEQYMENRKARSSQTPSASPTPLANADASAAKLPPEALALLNRIEEEEALLARAKEARKARPPTPSQQVTELPTPSHSEVDEDYIDPVVAALDVAEENSESTSTQSRAAQPEEKFEKDSSTNEASHELRRLERGADEFVSYMRNLRALLADSDQPSAGSSKGIPCLTAFTDLAVAAQLTDKFKEEKQEGCLYVAPPPQSADMLLRNAYYKNRGFYDKKTHAQIACVEEDGFITDLAGTVIGYLTPQQRNKRRVPPSVPLPVPPSNSPAGSGVSTPPAQPQLPLPPVPSQKSSVASSHFNAVGDIHDIQSYLGESTPDADAAEYLRARKASPDTEREVGWNLGAGSDDDALLNVELEDTDDLESLGENEEQIVTSVQAQRQKALGNGINSDDDADDVNMSQTSVCIRLLNVTGSSGLTVKPVRHALEDTDLFISDDSFSQE